jgi:hypothetical protein
LGGLTRTQEDHQKTSWEGVEHCWTRDLKNFVSWKHAAEHNINATINDLQMLWCRGRTLKFDSSLQVELWVAILLISEDILQDCPPSILKFRE